jgi:hypothetical protein
MLANALLNCSIVILPFVGGLLGVWFLFMIALSGGTVSIGSRCSSKKDHYNLLDSDAAVA